MLNLWSIRIEPCDQEQPALRRKKPVVFRDCQRVADAESTEVEWLWNRWIPFGKITLLEGDPGLGKSMLALSIAARVSRGLSMPDGTSGAGGNVLVWSVEDGLSDTVRPRLEAAGADLTHVWFDDQMSLSALDHQISKHEISLLVIDPAVMLVAILGKNPSRDDEVRQVLQPLAEILEKRRVASLLIHLNKKEDYKALYRGSGSISWIAMARSALMVLKHPRDDQRRVLACTKNNLAPRPRSIEFEIIEQAGKNRPEIAWLGESSLSADDILKADDSAGRMEAEEFLLDHLAAGPMASAELERIAKDQGIASRTLARARKSLRVIAKQGPDGWCVSLPGQNDRLPECHPLEVKIAGERSLASDQPES